MKKIWESKTLWVNFLAFVAIVAQLIAGKELISPEQQVLILTLINFALRIITKDEITW